MSELLPENWMEHFRAHLFPLLTPERFAFVRELRCEKGETWRGVSSACFEAWSDLKKAYPDHDGDQPIGMALCEFAADHFGERADSKPWN